MNSFTCYVALDLIANSIFAVIRQEPTLSNMSNTEEIKGAYTTKAGMQNEIKSHHIQTPGIEEEGSCRSFLPCKMRRAVDPVLTAGY
jgi:hypothetical protein